MLDQVLSLTFTHNAAGLLNVLTIANVAILPTAIVAIAPATTAPLAAEAEALAGADSVTETGTGTEEARAATAATTGEINPQHRVHTNDVLCISGILCILYRPPVQATTR